MTFLHPCYSISTLPLSFSLPFKKSLTVSTSDIGHLAVGRLLSQRKVSSSLVRELLYADDCDIVAHSEDELQCFMNHFVSACNSFGLKINLKKTVVMYDPAPGSSYIEPIIFVDVVHSFVYLGSTLSEECSLDREISFHIERASRYFSALNKRVWPQYGIKLHTKIIEYEVYVLMALLYASETWTLYKHQLKLLEGFHQRCLRQILHIKWQSHVSDTKVLGKAGLPSIQSMVMKSYLRWVGHIVRMDDGRLQRQFFYGDMWEGKRRALKPKKRLKDTIKYYLKQSGKKWGEKWLQIEVSGGN